MSVPAPVLADSDTAFYAAAEKIYPRETSGRFSKWRKIAMVVLLGLFYSVSWISVNGRQVLLFDLPARKFYIFGLTLWPQDFLYLAILLILAALSLFFVTAMAGRLWCGYACPQTVWTELFTWIELRTEGTRSKRIKLDQGPWTLEKLRRKGLKQLLWVALAAYTGFSFVGYFVPIRSLAGELWHGTLGPAALFWICLYSLATYGNAGFLREQVCKYMCPYARFQSAMFDRNTLIIAYDQERGEPRGARRRGTSARDQGLGDCIDCTLCVQVCPTGIDIRHGLQNECIACGACIDACDEVMDKMQSPRGLIRYTSEDASRGIPARIVRPRTLVYAALLLAIAGYLVYSLFTRVPLIVDVIRDRNALYREVGESIENTYTLKVINLDSGPHSFRVQADGIDQLRVAEPAEPFRAPPGTVNNVVVRLQAPATRALGVKRIVISVVAIDREGTQVHESSRFIGPRS